MLLKWAIGGAIICGLFAAYSGFSIIHAALFGAVIAVIFRKWIFRNLWI